ncbi:hypothetical protein M8C21_023183 [Ambrosia artemisiifolia]|uniref:AIPP2-like SPOC-like domain-containing protein n=1 Tax=Ambrosia artemisiifolia TaxID=4212 RepID=A0AAD5CPA4_AMBAR|nr:hypothetical protein M8C21_023183 [Ambrosia artemisiifolia]
MAMGLVCETCGAEGYTNAFIYCVRCLGYVIHRYCLAVMPETNDEFVKWYCDDCKPRPYYFTSPPKHDPPHSQNEGPPNSALVKKTHPKKKPKKKSLKKRKLASLVEAGKDDECFSGPNKITQCVVLGLAKWEHKSLQVQEKVATCFQKDEVSLETAKSNDQQCVETSSNSLLKEASANSDSGANQITPRCAEDDNCFSTKGIVRRKGDTTRVIVKTKNHNTEKSNEHSSCESSCTDAALKNDEDSTHTEEGLKHVPDHDKLVSNSLSIENQLIKSKEYPGSAYASQSDYMKNNIQYIDCKPTGPRPDPVWRGSFNIIQTDYDLFEGIAGHLSVCDEATTLPSMLSLEMDTKAHLWPNSFERSMPTDANIGLYFFPGAIKNERDYEQLVNDMIEKDLAMKTSSKNAEMLIFTSRVLPQSFWRIRGKHYLWGVFKGKQKDAPAANPSDNRVLSSTFGNEVTSETETIKRMKTIESHSPQSPLCSYR